MSSDLSPLFIRDGFMQDLSVSLPSTPRGKVHKLDLPMEDQGPEVIGSVSAVFQEVMEGAPKLDFFPLPHNTSPLKRRRFSFSGDSEASQSMLAASGGHMDRSLGSFEPMVPPSFPLTQDFDRQRSEVESKHLKTFLSPTRTQPRKRGFPLNLLSLSFPPSEPRHPSGLPEESSARLGSSKRFGERPGDFPLPASDACLRLPLMKGDDDEKQVFFSSSMSPSSLPLPFFAAPPALSLKQMLDANYVLADILCKNIPKVLSKINREDRALKLFRALEKMSLD